MRQMHQSFALCSRLVYKEAIAEGEVLRILQEGRGSFFDPAILDLFFKDLEAMREIQSRYVEREEDNDPFKNLDRVIIREEE